MGSTFSCGGRGALEGGGEDTGEDSRAKPADPLVRGSLPVVRRAGERGSRGALGAGAGLAKGTMSEEGAELAGGGMR
jgi:hypothetical protein